MQPFSDRIRVLPCDACGAGCEVPEAGGQGACVRCQAPLVVPPRPDTRVPRSPPMDEGQRLGRLRQQDGRPLLRPPGLENVLGSDGSIEAWRLNEARYVWNATRKHVAANPGDTPAAERLVFLTLALSNALAEANDPAALRALYEGALEAARLPRHRQLMRGYLARNAAKYGDLAASQNWLAGCDPGSDDLETDSVYRLSAAYLATARGDANGVFQTLGGNFADVPIADSMDVIATVLRANAWERVGRPDEGRNALARFMASQGGVSTAVEAVVRAMPPAWQVCAQSLQGARVDHRQHVGKVASGGAWVGYVFMGAGLFPVLIMIPIVLVPLLTGARGGPPIFVFGFVLVFPLVFGMIGWKMVQAAKRQKIIAEGGLAGRGRIVSLEPTGTRVNGVPQMRIHVQAQIPGHPPVVASTTKLLGYGMHAALVGREVPVIWHPQYPNEIVLEVS